MSSNTAQQPISFVERVAARDQGASSSPLTPAQHRGYRQLVIAALGLDVPTLTSDLRARRLQRMPVLRARPHADRAA